MYALLFSAAGLALVASGCAPRLAALPPPGLYTLTSTPALGTVDGVEIREGGFSGLERLADGRLVAVTDRGPNLDAEASAGRPAKRFPVPGYAPSLAVLSASDGVLRVASRTPILGPAGPVSGRPPGASAGATVETATVETATVETATVETATVETATGLDGEALAPDAWGLDAEGVADAGDGTLWLCEEYRPSLWRVDAATGRVVERVVPSPTEPFDRPLPAVLAARAANLGFEGVAVVQTAQGPRVVAVLQGPLQPAGALAGTPIARLLVLDPATGAAHTLTHALDGPLRKVGDAAALPDGRLLIVEHGVRPDGSWSADVVALDLAAGRVVDDAAAPPEAYASALEAAAAGVGLVPRRHVLDLVSAGWPPQALKPEGLVLSGRRLAVLSDNDYGLDAPLADGRATATGVPTVLLVVDLPEAP